MGNLGYFSADAYRALQTIPQREPDGKWTSQLMQIEEPTLLLDQYSQTEEAVLCYVRPQKIDRSCRAVMVMEIDRQALIQVFSQAQELFPEAFQLSILLDGEVIASKGDEVDAATVETMFAQWNQENDHALTHGDTAAYFSRSMLSGLYYASFYNAGRTMRTVRTTIAICAVCTLLTLLIGFVGTFYVSILNVRPVRKLLHRLGAQENDETDALNC